MADKATPTLCPKGCGNPVKGQGARVCNECAPKCACGNRRLADRPRCRSCAREAAANQIVWVKNRRGIYVARR